MGRPKVFPPVIRQKNGSDRVSHNGVWYVLGPTGSPESKLKYTQLVLQWQVDPASGQLDQSEYLVAELMADYLEQGDIGNRYRATQAATLFSERYGVLPVADFKPGHLVEFQKWLCEQVNAKGQQRWNITSIKQIMQVVRRAWEWGVVHERTTPEQLVALRLVKLPKPGQARDGRVVKPAPRETLELILPHIAQPVRDLLRVIAETGMRPSEVCQMTPAKMTRGGVADVPGRGREDLGDRWMYVLEKHKTRGKVGARYVLLNPTVRAILAPLWDHRQPDEPFFRPKDSPRSRNRKRLKFFTADAVHEATRRACIRAGIDPVTPYQFRHLAAVILDEKFGREVAQAMLGHTSEHMTSHYTGRNFAAAKKAAGE